MNIIWDDQSELEYLEAGGEEGEENLASAYQESLLDEARDCLAAKRKRWEMSPRFQAIYPSNMNGYSVTRLHDALCELAYNDSQMMGPNPDSSLLMDEVLAMSGFVVATKLGPMAVGVYLRRLGRALFRDCDLDDFVATVMARHAARAQQPATMDELRQRQQLRKRLNGCDS